MKECENNVTTKVVLDIQVKNYDKDGKLIDALESGAKLTKADAGRKSYEDLDSLSFKSETCGCGKLAIDYNSTTKGGAEMNETSLEVDLKLKKLDMNRNELIDAIAASSKLTKADAGRALDKTTEDNFHLDVTAKENAEGLCGCPEVNSHYTTKTINNEQ